MDVIDRGIRGGGGTRRTAGVDDLSTAFRDSRDVLVSDPGLIVDGIPSTLTVHFGVDQVGVLRRRVVAPAGHVGDRRDGLAELVGELRLGTVVVEPHHRGEALARHVRRVRHRDQAVGVGRVANHQDLDVFGGAGVDRFALGLEDSAVGLEQVGSFHARPARPGADQQPDVGAGEGLLRVVGDVDPLQQREGAVVELHRRALGGFDRLRDLQQAQLDRRVGTEHLAAGDAEQERIADLAGGAGNGDLDGSAHEILSSELGV